MFQTNFRQVLISRWTKILGLKLLLISLAVSIFNYIIIDDLRNGFSYRCARFNLGFSNGMKIEHHNLSYLGL